MNERRIIVRFDNQKDLDTFSNKLNISLDKNTKELRLPSCEFKVKKKSQLLREISEEWKNEWFDMPEFCQSKNEAYCKIDLIIDVDKISNKEIIELTEQNITNKTKSIWFPKLVFGKNRYKRLLGGDNPQYPIYVVSKGRWDKCLTSRYLNQMCVPHYLVVEPQEYNKYIEHQSNEYTIILKLDMKYKDLYDTCDDLEDLKSKGPGGARNYCWDHSISNGFEYHWVMDDNLDGFHRLNHNTKIKARSGVIFKIAEDFVNRYENVAISGLNYSKFCKENDKVPPYILNTRIYSCLLIKNNIPYRWRGRYNEDTDLSLRVLKDGYVTMQFNSFLADKLTTQKISGGNTEEFYAKEGTMPKSQMLQDLHPDVAKVVWKFNRWHHYVDYSQFKNNKLILKNNAKRNYVINEYNMYIIEIDEEDEELDKDIRKLLEQKYIVNNK